MPLLRRVLLVLGVGAFLVSDIHAVLTRPEPFRPGRELLRRVSPDIPPLLRREGRHGPYYADRAGESAAERPRAVAFLTDQVDPQVKGYGGEISLLVGLDSSGNVTGVRLVNHKETPSYMRTVVGSGFLEKLVGRKLGAEIAGVDAVTGATITSEAIKQDLQRGGASLGREVFGLEVRGVPAPRGFIRSLLTARSLAMLGAISLALAAFSLRSLRHGRTISLAGGLVAVGIYCGLPLSTVHFTSLASLRFPSGADAPLWLLLGFAFGTGIAFRSRVYCDYLCPFAAVQEGLYALTGRRSNVSDRVWRGATTIRYLLLFAISLLVAVGGYYAVGAMEPYVFLFNPGSEVLPWIYVGLALAAALAVKRFWCRVFCPCGTCLELIASLRRRRAAASETGGRR